MDNDIPELNELIQQSSKLPGLGPKSAKRIILKLIIISDAAKKENQDIINDLIIAAYNNARANLKKKSAEELSKATGGLNLPLDFKIPF